MNTWLSLSKEDQIELFTQVGARMNLVPQAIEKDAWVSLILRLIFSSALAPHFIFKGGTSLSKGYNLIQRFSEDVDLGIDRAYLKFEGVLSKGQIRKLRRACHTFVSGELRDVLSQALVRCGIDEDLYDVFVENETISDQDPETIKVNYRSVFDGVSYLPHRVLIEVSARSKREPNERVAINALVNQHFSGMDFTEPEFEVPMVVPQKTFIEKLILLHEEFQKPAEKIRHLRMSRHFYDIGQIIVSDFGRAALKDVELFQNIVEHRKVFTPMKTTDYDSLSLATLNIIPPSDQLNKYELDYKEMQDSMIYGNSVAFDVLLNNIQKHLRES